MKESFKIKAIERLETAKWCMGKDFTSSCVSNLYFAYFNFFQCVIGEPPKGRWKHIGIAKAFVYKAYRESSMTVKLIKAIHRAYEDLYDLRRKADYTDELLSCELKGRLRAYINNLEEAISYEG